MPQANPQMDMARAQAQKAAAMKRMGPNPGSLAQMRGAPSPSGFPGAGPMAGAPAMRKPMAPPMPMGAPGPAPTAGPPMGMARQMPGGPFDMQSTAGRNSTGMQPTKAPMMQGNMRWGGSR
jgi:hypothetical protein